MAVETRTPEDRAAALRAHFPTTRPVAHCPLCDVVAAFVNDDEFVNHVTACMAIEAGLELMRKARAEAKAAKK